MADPFDFGVKFDDMTPAQKRVHNIRAMARNAGVPVATTDELCSLQLDFPDWSISAFADVPLGIVANPDSLRSVRRQQAAPTVAELRIKLDAAEDEFQRAGAEWW